MCREPRLLCPERPWNGLRQATLLSLLQKTQVLAVLHNLQLLYRLFCLLQQTHVLAVLHNLQLLYRLFWRPKKSLVIRWTTKRRTNGFTNGANSTAMG